MQYRKSAGPLWVLGIVVGVAVLGWSQFWKPKTERVVAVPAPTVEVSEEEANGLQPMAESGTREDAAREDVDSLVETALVSTEALTYRILGRVVDEARIPVREALVQLSPEDRVRTLEDGTFELSVNRAVADSEWEEGLIATAEENLAHRVAVTFPAEKPESSERITIELGTLVLLPRSDLQIRVLNGDAPVPGARLRIEQGHQRMLLLQSETDERGESHVDGVPRGPIHVTAVHEGALAYERVFVPERAELVLQLEPAGSREILVVDAETGAGIEGARLSVQRLFMVPAALPEATGRFTRTEFMQTGSGPGDGSLTDEGGRSRIGGLFPGETYRVSVTATGYAPFPERGEEKALLTAGPEPLRIELQTLSYGAVRWSIRAGEVPVPPSGSPFVLRHAPGSSQYGTEAPPLPEGRMDGTDLVVDGYFATGTLLAEAEDGALAELRCNEGAERGRPTSFRKPRRIEVRVTDPQGQPVAAAELMARNQGNNPLCAWSPTNAEGVAILESLFGELADVYLRGPGRSNWGEGIGSVNLAEGGATLEAVLHADPTPGRLRLSIFEDGAPRLPGRFKFQSRVRTQVVEEHPHRGELLVEFSPATPGEEVRLAFAAVGYRRDAFTFMSPADGSEAVARIDLERTAILIAEVSLPQEGTVFIYPQKLDPESGEYTTPRELFIRRGLNVPNGPGDSFVFAGITPGTWRVFEKRSGAVSGSVEVSEHDREVRIPLELSTLGWVSGRVEAASPSELEYAKVRLIDELAKSKPSGLPGETAPQGSWLTDGAFRIQVPGHREVRIECWHPWLQPDPERGSVITRGARDGVVLKLVEGDELRLPVPQLDEHVPFVRVARYAGYLTEGEPLEWHHAPIVDQVVRCGLPRGTWSFWIDPGEGFAPLELHEIEISGVTELPSANFTAGSAIALRLEVKEGNVPPRIYLFATRLDAPSIQRGMNSDGESVPQLSGLAPGRYRVSYGLVMSHTEREETELVLEADSEIELSFDVR